MGTFYSKNDYRNYLAHYGVKGMNRPSGLKYNVRKKKTIVGQKTGFIEESNRQHARERREMSRRDNEVREENQYRESEKNRLQRNIDDARESTRKKIFEERQRRTHFREAEQLRNVIRLDKERRESLLKIKRHYASNSASRENRAPSRRPSTTHRGANWTHRIAPHRVEL